MFKKKKNLFEVVLNRKYKILYFICSFMLFYFFKERVLDNYLIKAANIIKLHSISEKKVDFEKLVEQENMWLRDALSLPQKKEEQRKFGSVVNVVFSNSSFFVKFENAENIEIDAAIYFQDRLIGFIEEINKNIVKVRPTTHQKSRFTVQTTDSIGMLLVGNGRDLKIELSNSSDYKDGDVVLFNNYTVGYVCGKNKVVIKDFARIKCVYLSY